MLNLNQELKQLESLSEIVKTSMDKVGNELSKIDTSQSQDLKGFLSELDEVMKTGKGINELQNKVNNYESN